MFKTVDADESSTLTADEVVQLNDVLCRKYERFGAGSLEYSESKFYTILHASLLHENPPLQGSRKPKISQSRPI